MITCEYMGRGGNNGFQICITYAKAFEFNENPEFLPHPWFPWLPPRKSEVLTEFIAPDKINEIYNIEHMENMTLVGFFQRHEYFDHIKDFIIDEVWRVPNDWQPNATAIHVRRGDFLIDPVNFPPISIEYIEKALSLIENKQRIVFCSDDLDWCKNHFPGYEYRENTEPLQDIYFMANCDNVIMSNSTFSFWGAYLSKRERQIIFPLNWFGTHKKRNGYEICPKNWTGI